MGPFIKDEDTIFKINLRLFIALIPLILYKIYKFGYLPYQNSLQIIDLLTPIINIIISVVISLLIDNIFKLLKRPQNTIIYNILLAIIMPADISKLILIFGNIIICISKLIPKLNPIAIASLFLLFIFKIKVIETIDINFGIKIIIYSISLIYLLNKKNVKWRIVISYFITLVLLNGIINQFEYQSLINDLVLIMGIFILPDYQSTAVTPFGQIVQGIVAGSLTFLFNVLDVNIMFSILVSNIFVSIIDKFGMNIRLYNKN